MGGSRQKFVQLAAQAGGFKAGDALVLPVGLDQRQQLAGIRNRRRADVDAGGRLVSYWR